MSITVVSTARNAKDFAGPCILSVREQSLRARMHYYVDAGSDDRTLLSAIEAAGDDERITIVSDPSGHCMLENVARVIRELPPEEIVAWLDGDDELLPNALRIVSDAYASGDVWMTYGSFRWSSGRTWNATAYPSDVVAANAYRQDHWRATHLKTFRAGLFHAIPETHLRDRDGAWFPLAVDQAVMLPALELAGERHRFLREVIYLYNDQHSFERSASREEIERELATLARIRAKRPLERLDVPPWRQTLGKHAHESFDASLDTA